MIEHNKKFFFYVVIWYISSYRTTIHNSIYIIFSPRMEIGHQLVICDSWGLLFLFTFNLYFCLFYAYMCVFFLSLFSFNDSRSRSNLTNARLVSGLKRETKSRGVVRMAWLLDALMELMLWKCEFHPVNYQSSGLFVLRAAICTQLLGKLFYSNADLSIVFFSSIIHLQS